LKSLPECNSAGFCYVFSRRYASIDVLVRRRAGRVWKRDLIFDRFEAFKIGKDCLQICIRKLGIVLPGHGRQNVALSTHELAGAKNPDEQFLVPDPCAGFRIW
jgi:hypothetical protein